MIFRGRARVVGDDVTTDHIVPGKYLKLGEAEAATHLLEGYDPAFAATLRRGDIIVAGRNFGAGSSRDYAAIAIREGGVSCVIAPLFARIFFRNAINQGLTVLECADAARIAEGDELEVDVAEGRVRDRTSGLELRATRLPPHILELIEAGGLIPYLERRLARAGAP